MRAAIQATQRRVIISGMDELHLEVLCDRFVREFGVPLHLEGPTVIYLETIRKHSAADGKYIRQVGGSGQYAHVELELEPGERGGGYQFMNQSSEAAVPGQFLESIESGIQEALKGGVLGGNEIVDVRVVLRGGSYHEEDSNEMAFKIAASMAVKEASRRASPVVLEPLMSLDVFTSEDFVGTIIGDLASRRGRIESIRPSADGVGIHAMAPLAELLGYQPHLRFITQGQSSFAMQFVRYEAVPNDGGSGPDEIGVPAKKPRGPTQRSGAASANPDELCG